MFEKQTVSGDKSSSISSASGPGWWPPTATCKASRSPARTRSFANAVAKIEGDTVVVSSDHVPSPVAVRYGWADFPVVNLWNKDGLPACPFRTDDFPAITRDKK